LAVNQPGCHSIVTTRINPTPSALDIDLDATRASIQAVLDEPLTTDAARSDDLAVRRFWSTSSLGRTRIGIIGSSARHWPRGADPVAAGKKRGFAGCVGRKARHCRAEPDSVVRQQKSVAFPEQTGAAIVPWRSSRPRHKCSSVEPAARRRLPWLRGELGRSGFRRRVLLECSCAPPAKMASARFTCCFWVPQAQLFVAVRDICRLTSIEGMSGDFHTTARLLNSATCEPGRRYRAHVTLVAQLSCWTGCRPTVTSRAAQTPACLSLSSQ